MGLSAAPRDWALGTFASGGRQFAGLVVGDKVHALGDIVGLARPGVRELLEHWPYVAPQLQRLADSEGEQTLALAGLDVLAPIEPRQIFQSGANYRNHVIDLAMAHRELTQGQSEDERRAAVTAELDERAKSGTPYIFTGLPTALCGPYDDVILPLGTQKNDWELELVAVIGTPARRVSPEQALDHVVGYTIGNDITTRESVFRRDMKEIGTDWFASKNSPTFLPIGPFIVPASMVADPSDLRLTLRLNGEVMQDESTKDMLFDVAAIVSYCSSIATLLPGDLVFTGSPAGNGMARGRLLQAGDVMEASITGLGTIRNACVNEPVARR